MDKAANMGGQWWNLQLSEAEKYEELIVSIDKHQDDIERLKVDIEIKEEKKNLITNDLEASEALVKTSIKMDLSDTEVVLKKYNEYKQVLHEQKIQLNKMDTLLQQSNIKTAEDLDSKIDFVTINLASILNNWKKYVDEHPGLPDAEIDQDTLALSEKMRNVEEEIKDLDSQINELSEQSYRNSQELGHLEGQNPVNIAEEEIRIKELEVDKDLLGLKADALSVAYKELDSSIKEFNENYQQRLESKAGDYFNEISGNDSRRINISHNLDISVVDDGIDVLLDTLSRGAKDQLYLSLRFAVGDFLSNETMLPFIFDDTFTNTDIKRLERIREILESEKERQFFIISHLDIYKGWGKEIVIC
jgi:hypothetical protein